MRVCQSLTMVVFGAATRALNDGCVGAKRARSSSTICDLPVPVGSTEAVAILKRVVPRLARACGQHREEAARPLRAAALHLVQSAFLVLVQLERAVHYDARVLEAVRSAPEVGTDVVLETLGEADVLGGEAIDLYAEQLAGVLLGQLVAVPVLADDLRVVEGHAVFFHTNQAAIGSHDVVDEARGAVEVRHAVLAGEEPRAVVAVDTGEVLLECPDCVI